MKMHAPAFWRIPVLLILAAAAGCTTYRVSNTARTPEEEILLARAADKAIGKAGNFSAYAGKKVFLDASSLECVDKAYVVDALRQALSTAGARVVDKADGEPAPQPKAAAEAASKSGDKGDTADTAKTSAEPAPKTIPGTEADVIVTVRSGMLATQHGESLLGLPAFKVPVPMVGTVETPEIAFYKRVLQEGRAAIAVAGYRRADRTLVADGCGEGIGRTHFTRWGFLILIHYTTTDVDALR